MSEYELTVGLEIHVELKTKTKMFCGCKNDPFNSKPNVNVCPVCYGLPGALPLLNKEAIWLTVKLGQALGGQVASTTFWARKNYFYPDLPKGYQISQSNSPIVESAELEIDRVKHRIARIHLEEDAGKSVHQAGQLTTLVNFNRAGVPLMEMVTEPDFDSAEDAKRFCQEIQRIVRALEISDADMEKGQMRCEANVSVAPTNPKSQIPNPKLGTKVEVKNINSFRAVEKAIRYEYERQVELLNRGELVVTETRTWDSIANQTTAMRSKETSADYRYFPEPDLPMVAIEARTVKNLTLPEDRRRALEAVGVPAQIARTLVDKQLDRPALIVNDRAPELAKEAAHLMLESMVFATMSADNQIELLVAKKKSGWTNDTLSAVIEEVGRGQPIDQVVGRYIETLDLEPIIEQIMTNNQSAVKDYRSGKENALHFLVGQVMAKTQGKANITEVRTKLVKILKSA